jgi:hypothetical protein
MGKILFVGICLLFIGVVGITINSLVDAPFALLYMTYSLIPACAGMFIIIGFALYILYDILVRD